MIQTVISDMDGLLVDSEPLWVEAMQDVFEEMGVHITPQMAMATTGLRTSEVVVHWQQEFGWTRSNEEIGNAIIESVLQKLYNRGTLMEGALTILQQLQAAGVTLGLASSSPRQFIDAVLQHFGIAAFFSAVASAEFEPFGKPHPAVYLSCAGQLGARPVDCLAFEDSINGMIAAKAARMKVVAVPEMHHRDNPRYVLADLRLNSLLEFDVRWLEEN